MDYQQYKADCVKDFVAATAFVDWDDRLAAKSLGASAFGVGEYMQLADVQSLNECKIIFPASLCLATHADHAIDANKGMGHHLAYMLYALGK